MISPDTLEHLWHCIHVGHNFLPTYKSLLLPQCFLRYSCNPRIMQQSIRQCLLLCMHYLHWVRGYKLDWYHITQRHYSYNEYINGTMIIMRIMLQNKLYVSAWWNIGHHRTSELVIKFHVIAFKLTAWKIWSSLK